MTPTQTTRRVFFEMVSDLAAVQDTQTETNVCHNIAMMLAEDAVLDFNPAEIAMLEEITRAGVAVMLHSEHMNDDDKEAVMEMAQLLKARQH